VWEGWGEGTDEAVKVRIVTQSNKGRQARASLLTLPYFDSSLEATCAVRIRPTATPKQYRFNAEWSMHAIHRTSGRNVERVYRPSCMHRVFITVCV